MIRLPPLNGKPGLRAYFERGLAAIRISIFDFFMLCRVSGVEPKKTDFQNLVHSDSEQRRAMTSSSGRLTGLSHNS
jgi:hypothetical protein